jgi:outer membrane protein TolC
VNKHLLFLLLRTSRKTERGAGQFLVRLVVRAAPFALLLNSRKTERGAGQFLVRLAVLAAPFALLLPAAFGAEVHSLTLPQAIDLALRQSPDVVLARLDEQKAQAGIQITRDPFVPKVYAGSGLAYTSGYPNSIDGAAPSIIQVRTDMAIYNKPRSLQVAQSRESARGAGIQVRSKTEEVAFRIAATFLDASLAARDLELARHRLESLEHVRDIVQARVAEGRELQIVSRRADVDIARGRQRLSGLQSDLAYAEGSLALVLGFPPDDRVHALADEDALAASLEKAQPASEDAAVEAALASSYELKSLESQMTEKSLELRAQTASRLPQINLVAQYALFAKSNYVNYFTRFQRNNEQIGVSITLPLLVGTAAKGQATQAEIEITRLRQHVSLQRSRVSLETRRGFEDARNASDAQALAKLDLEVTRDQLSLVLAQLDEGRATLQQVEEARVAEQEKWMLYFEAQDKLQRARLGLLRQTGSLLAALHLP